MTAVADIPIVSRNPAIQAHYETCRRNGCGHGLAEILAFRQPPKARTDREFMMGLQNGQQFDGDEATACCFRDIAAADGVSVAGKYYETQLADFPGDPKAWVDGRGDVARVCEERGFGCDGAVKVQGRKAPQNRVGLADDIVHDQVEMLVADDPSLAPKRDELANQVREKHTPHWAKKK